MDNKVILPIQWLRGVAAMMVVWFHATGQLDRLPDFVPGRFGEIGVDIFFVISGFIMVAVAGRATTPLAFFRDRLVRVVPLYWAITMSMVALAILPPHLFANLQPTFSTTVQSLLFVPHFSDSRPGLVWPLLVPGWTLNYEIFFYLLFSASLVFRGRASVVLSVACCCLVLTGYVCGPFADAVARTYTDPLLLEFVAGVMLGEAWRRGLAIRPLALAVIVLVLGAVLVLLGDSPGMSSGRVGQALGAVMVVAACARSGVRRDIRVLRMLGDASYSIYLTHVLVLAVFRKLWIVVAPQPLTLAISLCFMGLALVACAVVGWGVHVRIERPLTDMVRSRIGPRRAPASGPAHNRR